MWSSFRPRHPHQKSVFEYACLDNDLMRMTHALSIRYNEHLWRLKYITCFTVKKNKRKENGNNNKPWVLLIICVSDYFKHPEILQCKEYPQSLLLHFYRASNLTKTWSTRSVICVHYSKPLIDSHNISTRRVMINLIQQLQFVFL